MGGHLGRDGEETSMSLLLSLLTHHLRHFTRAGGSRWETSKHIGTGRCLRFHRCLGDWTHDGGGWRKEVASLHVSIVEVFGFLLIQRIQYQGNACS